MDVIYTYKVPRVKIYSKEVNQKEWIKKSINSVRMVGYSPHLYTNCLEFAKDLDLDNITYIEDRYPEIWDSIKIEVLQQRDDLDYFLSDNDIIYKKPIDFLQDIDMFFDGFEIYNWDWVYQKSMNTIKRSNIFKFNPIWAYDKIPVMNLGILKLNNRNLKSMYINEWITGYRSIQKSAHLLSSMNITPVLSQYLLTLICNKENILHNHFTIDGKWPGSNPYYSHYPGYLKFKQTTTLI